MARNHFLQKKIRIAILTGGPSLERGISLNSARSVLDHLGSLEVDVVPIYFDEKKKPYKISTAQLYSNTPSDFDFKLRKTGRFLSESALIRVLKSVDIVFRPFTALLAKMAKFKVFLEKHKIPFIGT